MCINNLVFFTYLKKYTLPCASPRLEARTDAQGKKYVFIDFLRLLLNGNRIFFVFW